MSSSHASASVQGMNTKDPSSPYYIHHSSSPNLAIVSQALTGENYITWSRAMQIALSAKNKISLVDGSIQKSEGRIPFLFLEDIHERFVKTYGRACHSALAYTMNDEFSRVLSQQMDYYTNDPNADRINRIRGEMSQVRNVMIDNIDKILERGDRLELLVDRTANMQEKTIRFRKQARRFKNTVWWRNVKLTAALIVLLLIIIYVFLAFACHGITLPSCIGH